MKPAISLVLLSMAGVLCGCVTAGQTYAKKHPELPPQQLQILKTGKVPDGDAIAGMTREQVQVALGMEPTQYTKVDGHDAWVYVRRSLSATPLAANSTPELDRHDKRNKGSLLDSDSPAAASPGQIRTTVYFDGEVATHAETVNGGL